uniref:TIL domain-containing protein n=1 Tax=Acrobeloides nanus TaxID=290746 RepID=A0A914C4K6_9BILA
MKACTSNEEWRECSSACEFTCDDPKNEVLYCADVSQPPKCQCIRGYVRNSNGECVLRENCPRKTCALNEEWRECSTCEEGTFANPSPICTLDCRPPKCQCIDGYVRHPLTRKCVFANSNQC